ncbi:hypothetical protein GCM10028821_07170 [Hymenobacter jeollabukensis]|uniref:GIY-YIG nuclease family protein n=2 Tax=Hymenobacter jeollabukensis TaxID=2025313 RepID=A0A5R8WVP8_9BACT|nr:hypothetical protein FDY95_00525 [Hymenobacter jeollabukensis]
MDRKPTTTIIIEWEGPYSLEELKRVEKGNGLYLLTGREDGKRGREDELQYCGITEKQFCERVKHSHHKVKLIRKDSLQIWIGCLIYPHECVRQHLEDAERAFVSFWDIQMNDKKKRYYPDSPICIVTRWFRPNGEPYQRFPASLQFIKQLDDVLWWDTDDWRVGNLRIQKFEDED